MIENLELDDISICFFKDFPFKSIFVGIPRFRSFDAVLTASDFNSSFEYKTDTVSGDEIYETFYFFSIYGFDSFEGLED